MIATAIGGNCAAIVSPILTTMQWDKRNRGAARTAPWLIRNGEA
jgi:hypothetical protein